jgi:5-methylcytosine-specific restriction enzyme subunit McrC
MLWWLSYCRKIKFPNYQTALGSTKSDFFEVLIYLFSKYTRQLMASSIYQNYEDETKELSFIKGRINTSLYITENVSKGRWHKVNCTYDAFVIDNKFNRIIKQVATSLFGVSKDPENRKHLREILFILDEVTDCQSTADECANIQFNPMFSSFETVRDYCTLFLRHSVSFSYKNYLKLFAFLLPMEYVFEDFIFGFIDREIEEIQARAQDATTYLDKNKAYQLKPDLLLNIGGRKVITDTKYKIVYADEKDLKNGISQSDIYQMIAYGIRFKINDIILLYPETIKQEMHKQSSIVVKDEFTDDVEVKIKAYQVPVINRALLNDYIISENRTISDIFEETKLALIGRIKEIYL